MRPLENLGEVGSNTETRKVCGTPFMNTCGCFLTVIYWQLVMGQKESKSWCAEDLLLCWM